MSGPLADLFSRPLMQTLFGRRTHRVSRGVHLYIYQADAATCNAPCPSFRP